jgi:hypothetical protein
MAEGFRDNATKNKRFTRTLEYPPGVFFGDVPAIDDELFDGVAWPGKIIATTVSDSASG